MVDGGAFTWEFHGEYHQRNIYIYQIAIDIDIGIMGFSPTNGVISSGDDLASKRTS